MDGRFRFYALWLCLVCIAVFVLQSLVSGFTEIFILNGSSWVQPWRFLSSIFLHGSIMHLAYNLFALALFGSIFEKLVGGRRFLFVFFVTGIIANLISVNFYNSSLGASGAIFGIIGALVIVRPLMAVWAFGLPMPMFMAGLLWAAGSFLGIFGYGDQSVGNIAHLSGMLVGFAIGLFYRLRGYWGRLKKKELSLDERKMRDWEDKHLR